MNAQIRFARAVVLAVVLTLALEVTHVSARQYERTNVTFKSQCIDCAAWYCVPGEIMEGENRPAMVIAHSFSAVQERHLDNFASKFAASGFVVVE